MNVSAQSKIESLLHRSLNGAKSRDYEKFELQADAALTQTKKAQKAEHVGEEPETVEGIVSKYNLRNISYSDLEAMTKALMKVGAIKESEYLDFLPPSNEYASINGTRNADWNAPTDYIGKLEDAISFAKTYTPFLSTEYLEKQLALKMRFAQ
jgi:hypothetical protein